MTQVSEQPRAVGEHAPDFSVPAVQEDRVLTFSDYVGRTPFLLGLFPGLYCPFCRRSLAHMSAVSEKLKPLGVDCLAIVATEVDNARLYYQFRPTRLALGADPTHSTHRSYGVPKPEPTPELMEAIGQLRLDPTGELPHPMPMPEAAATLNARDGFQPTDTDRHESQLHFTQLKGQFLIGRDGVIRWANIECSGKEGFSGLGKFPSQDDLLTAARLAF